MCCNRFWKLLPSWLCIFWKTAQNVLIRWQRFRFIDDKSCYQILNWHNICLLWVLDAKSSLNFYYYFFSSSKYPFCTAINWMWTFQPLVPNIHLPTDEDAQEDIRASIFCLLYSLWSQWEKDFYSKPNNFPFLWRLLCLVWFSSCLSPLTASLLLMEMQNSL